MGERAIIGIELFVRLDVAEIERLLSQEQITALMTGIAQVMSVHLRAAHESDMSMRRSPGLSDAATPGSRQNVGTSSDRRS